VPHWTELNGQNDIGGWPWPAATDQGGGTWKYTVQLDHHLTGTPEYGRVINHVYLNDSALYCGEVIVQWDPPIPPTNQIPIGFNDGANCTALQGWTCDPDSWSTALPVHIYEGSTFLGSVTANLASEAGINSACGNTPNHRFSWTIPDSLKDGVAHTLSAHPINTPVGSNPALPLSGTMSNTITCTLPPVNNAQCVAFNAPTTVEAGTSFWTTVVMKNNGTKTWAQATNHKLGANDSSVPPWTTVWSQLRVNLPASSVPSNADAVFQFSVTAPSGTTGPGTYANHGLNGLVRRVFNQ
jgi:hypothetical protein